MTGARNGKLIRILEADPDLAGGLEGQQLSLARHYAVARLSQVEPGPWQPSEALPREPGHIGLLVLDGLLKRDVTVANTVCAELLGQGDLLRPWEQTPTAGPATQADWEVLEPSRLAILDRRFAAVACRWPEIIDIVLSRAIQRSRRLAFHMALSHFTRVDERLLAVLWDLAGRWGRVRGDGVLLPVRLTHETLARLVGAQRPSVTTALGQLSEARQVTRHSDGYWLLLGDPPATAQALNGDAAAAP